MVLPAQRHRDSGHKNLRLKGLRTKGLWCQCLYGDFAISLLPYGSKYSNSRVSGSKTPFRVENLGPGNLLVGYLHLVAWFQVYGN